MVLSFEPEAKYLPSAEKQTVVMYLKIETENKKCKFEYSMHSDI